MSGLAIKKVTKSGGGTEMTNDSAAPMSASSYMVGFSFFQKPIQNTIPTMAVTVVEIYQYLVSDYAKERTNALRALTSPAEARAYKVHNFDYCTFGGIFEQRGEQGLLLRSGLMCIDFDHVDDPKQLKERLKRHLYFNTELLFTSPSGNGVKWVIAVAESDWDYSRLFKSVTNCINATGLPSPDMSGSDIARACFLPYDPEAFINPMYKYYVDNKIFRPAVGECPF